MKKLFGFILIGICVVSCVKVQSENELSVIPYPAKLEIKKGYFTLSGETRLVVNDQGQFVNETAYLQQFMLNFLNRGLAQATKETQNILVIELCDEKMPLEGYKLDITPNRIHLSSPYSEGIFYGLQTLRQMLFSAQFRIHQGDQNTFKIPCVSITDSPVFEWRGLMLDVSRHFFSIEYLKKQIDLLSYFKMNKFHLHLTDDQGWRIEIKKYPGLTQKGAWRTFNRNDLACIENAKTNPDYELDPRFIIYHDDKAPLYGGYYTQDQIKELIQYAQARHVEIIPEIDMPGHMSAAISLFPELSCPGKVGWGTTFSHPLCPSNEATYTFLQNVLDEIADLFPSRYIHIGVDEVEKKTWEESDACKNLMKENGLENVLQLQTYFVKRIQNYLSAKGKEIITWDEVLEGGINSDVNVMFWRDFRGGVEKIIDNGNKIIFVPATPLYFSRRGASLFPVYNSRRFFNVVPEDKQHLIKGVQACVWSEMNASEMLSNSRIYPRLLALSEIAWTKKGASDWSSFKQRLTHQLLYLDTENIPYPPRSYELFPFMSADEKEKTIRLELESELIDPVIYYTTDGSMPTEQSQRYKNGIIVKDNAKICAAIFDKGAMQTPYFSRSLDYHKAIGKPVTYHTKWHIAYPANVEHTLTDGFRGSEQNNDGEHYKDGFWQGFTNDLDVTIDMQESTFIQSFSAVFMQRVGHDVYMPEYVEISLSDDDTHFEKALVINNEVPETEQALIIRKFSGEINKEARYVRVFAKNKNGFIFTDEFVIY